MKFHHLTVFKYRDKFEKQLNQHIRKFEMTFINIEYNNIVEFSFPASYFYPTIQQEIVIDFLLKGY